MDFDNWIRAFDLGPLDKPHTFAKRLRQKIAAFEVLFGEGPQLMVCGTFSEIPAKGESVCGVFLNGRYHAKPAKIRPWGLLVDLGEEGFARCPWSEVRQDRAQIWLVPE